MCAHVTTLYLINVTDCCGSVGNVSKYARLNERSRGGIMGFHNTPLLLGMRVCVFGRRTRHIALSPSQIYTHKRLYGSQPPEGDGEHHTFAEPDGNLAGLFGSPGRCSPHDYRSYPMPPSPLAGLQSHCPRAQWCTIGVSACNTRCSMIFTSSWSVVPQSAWQRTPPPAIVRRCSIQIAPATFVSSSPHRDWPHQLYIVCQVVHPPMRKPKTGTPPPTAPWLRKLSVLAYGMTDKQTGFWSLKRAWKHIRCRLLSVAMW